MPHIRVEQNTEEWLALRLGKFTASAFKAIMGDKTKLTYRNEIYRVAYERIAGESPESFTNEWMQRGHELESEARAAYEVKTGSFVEEGGFWTLGDYIGASPDGLVGEDGLLEIKCPKYSTHIQYLLDDEVPSQYKWQLQGQLLVTRKDFVDFVSYHPKLPLFIRKVGRDHDAIARLEDELEEAIKKVDDVVRSIFLKTMQSGGKL